MKRPRVGQRVRLNDYGLEQIFGSARGLSDVKDKVMKITWVDCIPAAGTDIWPVEVDDENINKFLIDNLCFDDADPGDGYAIVLEGWVR